MIHLDSAMRSYKTRLRPSRNLSQGSAAFDKCGSPAGRSSGLSFDDPAFSEFTQINVLPLIYDEKNRRCNILVFDYHRAREKTARIVREDEGYGRKHPVYRFYDRSGDYVCEVRYGGATANALQRGLWTNTKNGLKYFDSITNGWVTYEHNLVLVKLFSHALVSSSEGHEMALEKVREDIARLKKKEKLTK